MIFISQAYTHKMENMGFLFTTQLSRKWVCIHNTAVKKNRVNSQAVRTKWVYMLNSKFIKQTRWFSIIKPALFD